MARAGARKMWPVRQCDPIAHGLPLVRILQGPPGIDHRRSVSRFETRHPEVGDNAAFTAATAVCSSVDHGLSKGGGRRLCGRELAFYLDQS